MKQAEEEWAFNKIIPIVTRVEVSKADAFFAELLQKRIDKRLEAMMLCTAQGEDLKAIGEYLGVDASA